MNDRENKHKDNFDEFLDKAAKGRLEDDFEKDAAEGFSSLGLEEAHELKAQTDRRVASLFSYGKRKQAVQWSLAAGVALLVSMTIYFLRQDVTIDNSKMAQTDISEKKEEIMVPPPAMAPQAITAAEEKQAPKALPRAATRTEVFKEKETSPVPQTVNNVEEDQESKAAEPESQFQLASSGKANETTQAPANRTEAPKPVAASAGAGAEKGTEAAPPSENAKVKKAKKPDRTDYRAMPSAAREDAAADKAPQQYLNNILRKKLDPQYQKEFTATITLENGTVKDVLFTSDGLSKNEKKVIGNSLRELTAGELKPTGVDNGEIKLDYRP
jgi:hypothetical protein